MKYYVSKSAMVRANIEECAKQKIVSMAHLHDAMCG